MKDMKQNVMVICLVLLTFVVLTTALQSMKSILVPFVFSLFLYFSVSPITSYLRRQLRIPKVVTLFMVFAMLVVSLTIVVAFLSDSLKTFIQSSGAYQLQLLKLLDNFSMWIADYGYEIDLSVVRQYLLELPILQWLTNFSGGIVGIVGNLVLIIIFTFFLIIGKETGEKSILDEGVQRNITRYIMTKFLLSSVTGTLVGIVLLLFDVQLAFMFAALTFFLNFIPNVGSIIATLLPLPVILLQFGYGIPFIVIISLTSAIQLVVGNIIDPKLMGDNLGLHPVVILLSLLFWGFVWGVPGMFLSVPMTAIIKLLLSRVPITEPISQILEGKFNFQIKDDCEEILAKSQPQK